MATRLKNVLDFVNVPPGATVSLPHGIAWSPPAGGDLPQIPDHLTPKFNPGFTISADDTFVTVTNNLLVEASISILCELWHTFERAFGASSVLELSPRPFIEDNSGGGGGGCCLSDEDPLTVTGPTNTPGVAGEGSRVDHQHRLGLIVDDEGALVGAVPELNFMGAGVTAALVGDRVDVTIPGAAPHDCEDCLATGAEPPTQIDIGDAQVVGVIPLAARADHQHAFPAPPAPPTVTGAVNGTGAATTAARADHQHRLGLIVDDEGALVGAVPELNFLGAGVTAALVGDRVDVAITAANVTVAGSPTQIDIGDVAIVGASPDAAHADHQHAFPAPPAPPTVTGAVNGTGAATTAARADHQHRLGLLVDDEGVVVGVGRPEINFIGMGVGAVDNPGLDRVDVTIPGSVTDGAVVKRSLYKGDTVSTSSGTYVDAMSGGSVVVPMDGDYLALFESETFNSNANAVMQVGISVNSVVAVVATSERRAQGNASDYRTVVTSVQVLGLVAGDLVRALFKKLSGAGSVSLVRRHLMLIKVQ